MSISIHDSDDPLIRAKRVAKGLQTALRDLIESVPGEPVGPTVLARRVKINRVTASKILNGISREDPFEMLQHIPGPESLRALADGVRLLTDTDTVVNRANRFIDEFGELIRDHFGTRDALNAAISTASDSLLKRIDETGRYGIYKGMRQQIGVDAATWLTSIFFVPVPGDDAVAVTTIHGAIGMRRLRSDVNIYFTFGKPFHINDGQSNASMSPIALDQFYENEPAPLITEEADGQLIHRLTLKELGKQSIVDMLTVSHDPKGSRRYALPGKPLHGVAIFPAIPTRTLLCDAIVHRDLFKGIMPELLVYKPSIRGPANPNDPSRDIDRIATPETIEMLEAGADRFEVAEIPRYAEMIECVSAQLGHSPDEFVVHRLRISYPTFGFQFVVGFKINERP